MPSPFPGMDPYLESPTHWSDFHSTFIHALRESINDRLPRNYVARIEEEVVLLQPDVLPKRVGPDVAVARDPLRTSGTQGGSGRVATAPELEPVTLANVQSLDPHTEAYIRIIRLPGHELVTVLELFSPTNKGGDGRGFYIEKRERLMGQPVNIVELDLIRAGKRLGGFDRPLPPGDYYAFVSRADRRPRTEAYAWTVRSRLPIVPVPLRAPDADVRLDIGTAFAVAYERGRYAGIVDYTALPPPPAFGPEDAEWVVQTAGAATRSP
jgi:hypothetical protein